MKSVTRATGRSGMPWLIRTLIDSEAEFLFVPVDQIESVARETGAIPYDTSGAELVTTARNARSTRSSRHTPSRTRRSTAWQ